MAPDAEQRSLLSRPATTKPARRRRAFWFLVALALLTLPIFAHGCHGDDVDHEPLFIPLRLNTDRR